MNFHGVLNLEPQREVPEVCHHLFSLMTPIAETLRALSRNKLR